MTSPLRHRRTSKVKHLWAMWKFHRKANARRRKRDRELRRLTR